MTPQPDPWSQAQIEAINGVRTDRPLAVPEPKPEPAKDTGPAEPPKRPATVADLGVELEDVERGVKRVPR